MFKEQKNECHYSGPNPFTDEKLSLQTKNARIVQTKNQHFFAPNINFN